jgi:hypothetical protein
MPACVALTFHHRRFPERKFPSCMPKPPTPHGFFLSKSPTLTSTIPRSIAHDRPVCTHVSVSYHEFIRVYACTHFGTGIGIHPCVPIPVPHVKYRTDPCPGYMRDRDRYTRMNSSVFPSTVQAWSQGGASQEAFALCSLLYCTGSLITRVGLKGLGSCWPLRV